MPPLFDRDAGADFHPVLHPADLVLELGVGPCGDDVVKVLLFQ